MNRDLGLLLLRLPGLGLALAHGLGKLTNLATGQGARFVEGVDTMGFPVPGFFAWAAAIAEVMGGLFVALGVGTRIAAAFCAFTMVVAAFLRHKTHLQFLANLNLLEVSPEVLQKWGKPELALVYLVCFLAVLLLGPGRVSLDHLRGRSK